MENNSELIEHLVRSGILRSKKLIGAFERCDRTLFVPDEFRLYAYEDRPLPIMKGQTISQPYTVAVMLELLELSEGNRVLDIGSGSGWTTALLADTVGESGYVKGVEIVPELVTFGQQNLDKAGIKNASILQSEPPILGKPGERFDRILVSASASHMPTELFDQLKNGGKLVIPIQNSIWAVTKYEDGTTSAQELPGFRFVPLIL